jgi:cobalt transporter subunit CbtB
MASALPYIKAIAMIPGMSTINTTTALPESSTKSLTKDRSVVGALTLLIGLGFVYFVGFAPLSAVHNAAHDTRHSAAFPCH